MKATANGIQAVRPGDLVHTVGRRVGDPGRAGEIVAVLGVDDHLHYRVRWEDGRESLLYPGEGTTIRPNRYEPASAD